MKNKIILLTIIFLTLWTANAYSQELSSNPEDLNISVRDPFKSWLPKIEEKVVMPPEEVTIVDGGVSPGEVAPQAIVEIQPPALKLNGIVWNTNRPQAIINDQIVAIGDTIENSKIVDINKSGVDIIFANKLYTIQIDQPLTQSI